MTDKDNYKVSMAEFKGRVLAHLDDIKEDISEIKKDLKTKACKDDVADLRKRIDNIKLASAVVGGIGGLITGIGAFFGLKRV